MPLTFRDSDHSLHCSIPDVGFQRPASTGITKTLRLAKSCSWHTVRCVTESARQAAEAGAEYSEASSRRRSSGAVWNHQERD